MSKSHVHILCPSGHRRKVQLLPNDTLIQALEDICTQERLDSSEWGLMHQRSKCDLTVPWRMQSIPTNAVLEMYMLDNRRKTDDVHVQLQLPDSSKYSGWFEPNVTLQEMLDWYRIQPESMVAALEISATGVFNSCPIISYMTHEVIGEYALSNTTLRELGLTGGTATIRYNLRIVNDNELGKINARIDEKICRRNQQKYQQEQQSKQSKPTPKTEPVRSSTSPSTSQASPQPLTNSRFPASASNVEEHSIFADPPSGAALPKKPTRSQNQSQTLAESLGLNLSLDLESENARRPQSQNDFRNFKFPAATKGKELYRNEFEDDYQRFANVQPCNRRPIAYDTAVSRPTLENQDKRSAELDDKFYELTADDLRSVLNNLQQLNTNDSPLETQSMRDRAQSARTIVYEQIAIRLVVNKRHILQGLFRPDEPTSRLIDFARTTLVCPHIGEKDFYLYTTPPRVVLSDLRKPLSAYDLSPAAFVHFGHRTISSLNVQLAANIPIQTIHEANQLAAKYVFSRSRAVPERERERDSLPTSRPTSALSSITSRSTPRNPTNSNIDESRLRAKFQKFLPGKK